jgi:hypothetical protein
MSGFPLSAAELHLLIDWLESPQFPLGLYSQLAPPDEFVRQSLIKLGEAVWVVNYRERADIIVIANYKTKGTHFGRSFHYGQLPLWFHPSSDI